MRYVYRLGGREHTTCYGTDSGSILGRIARQFPREVGAIIGGVTERDSTKTTRDELVLALRAALHCLDTDPGLLFRYAFTTDIDPKPLFRERTGCSGFRFADTPADRVYALWCGPGFCDLEEKVIGADGRGRVVGVTDVRSRSSVETVTEYVGIVKLHRRPSKTKIRDELGQLLAVIETWPAGVIDKWCSDAPPDDED
jgi:hypothetical protein